MQLPTEAPVMTLAGVILFPQAMLPLHIFEPRYRRMLRDVLAGERLFVVAMQKPGRVRETPSPVAGLGLIRVAVKNRDGTSNLILQGLTRVQLGDSLKTRPYRSHSIRPLPPEADCSVEADALAGRVLEMVDERLELGMPALPPSLQELTAIQPDTADNPKALESFREVLQQVARQQSPEQLADLISATLLPDARQRQVILETTPLEARLRQLLGFLSQEIRRRRESSQ
ncbi:MAG: LON peptidase substrate-binding domain-containing protein [Limisphaerales bacterium]